MKALNKIKNLLKAKHPRQPFIYAVTAGKFLGELLVYAEQVKTDYIFLSLPEMHVRQIPVEKFDIGMQMGVVDIVEKLPAYVHKTCLKQYSKNKNSTLALKNTED
jgi:hypothetical protein